MGYSMQAQCSFDFTFRLTDESGRPEQAVAYAIHGPDADNLGSVLSKFSDFLEAVGFVFTYSSNGHGVSIMWGERPPMLAEEYNDDTHGFVYPDGAPWAVSAEPTNPDQPWAEYAEAEAAEIASKQEVKYREEMTAQAAKESAWLHTLPLATPYVPKIGEWVEVSSEEVVLDSGLVGGRDGIVVDINPANENNGGQTHKIKFEGFVRPGAKPGDPDADTFWVHPSVLA